MSHDLPLFSQLSVIKERFWRSLKEGGTCNCPVCGRFSHFNRFKIDRTRLQAMIKLYRLQRRNRDDYVHCDHFLTGTTRGFYDLKRWGFIEQKVKSADNKDKATSGLWRVTPKGADFLNCAMTVPKYVFVFDDKVQGYSSEEVDIHAVWGETFSYEEMLAGRYDIPGGL